MASRRIISNKPLTCPHCGGVDFDDSMARVETLGLAMFKIGSLTKTVTVYACVGCGRLEWFLDPIEG